MMALERDLRDDEQVLWQAMQLPRLEARGFGVYLFAIPWTAFAIMWTTFAVAGAANMADDGPGLIIWAFPLFGLPFILAGCAMMAMPWLPLIMQGRVLFAITNQRVLRISIARDLTVKSLTAERIGLVERRESRDGSGILRLAAKIGRDSDGDARTEYFEVGRIAEVMEAHRAINRLAGTQVG